MKKISIILLSILCPSSLFAQETLSLQQCREMALQYNKEMAASVKQTESALYTMKKRAACCFWKTLKVIRVTAPKITIRDHLSSFMKISQTNHHTIILGY